MRFVRYAFFGRLGLIVLAIAAPVVFFFAASLYQQSNQHTHHFRLVLEVEDHGERRSGSSVIRVTIAPPLEMLRGIDQGSAVTQGEAVVVELSTGQLVVATLRHGIRGDSDWFYRLAARAFGKTGPHWFMDAPNWLGSVQLSNDLIPLLLLFEDGSNPFDRRIIRPEDFVVVLGPDFRFHQMWLEMTSGPVTREIEQKLPFMAIDWDEYGHRLAVDSRKSLPSRLILTR